MAENITDKNDIPKDIVELLKKNQDQILIRLDFS